MVPMSRIVFWMLGNPGCATRMEENKDQKLVQSRGSPENGGILICGGMVVLTGLGAVLPESEVDTVEVALHAGGLESSANL